MTASLYQSASSASGADGVTDWSDVALFMVHHIAGRNRLLVVDFQRQTQ